MTVDSARAAGGGRGARRRAGTAATPPRVGMFGLLGQGSLGNDASMEAVLFYLRAQHPEVIVDALCSGPDAVASRFGIPAAPLRWYQPDRPRAPGLLGLGQRGLATCLGICIDAIRISSWVRRHDAVIVPGMGVFETSLPTRPWRTP